MRRDERLFPELIIGTVGSRRFVYDRVRIVPFYPVHSVSVCAVDIRAETDIIAGAVIEDLGQVVYPEELFFVERSR